MICRQDRYLRLWNQPVLDAGIVSGESGQRNLGRDGIALKVPRRKPAGTL
jgi:hypothetical protein